MQIKPRSYPHPVLSHFGDDIVGSVFQPVVSVKGTKNAYSFEAVFKTNNDDLLTLVESKRAMYAVHVECLQTRYRNLFTSHMDRLSFEIPAGLLDGRVEICSFILAARTIGKYRNSGFHPDYANLAFGVDRGDTLAVGQDREFSAEKKSDPLRKIPSIFSVVPDEAIDAAGIDCDTTGAKVVIKLSKKNFDSYVTLKRSQALHPILAATVVMPALVGVLEEIRRVAGADELDTYADRRWFVVVARRLREIGIDPFDPESFVDSSLKIAHELIGQPASTSLEDLGNMELDDPE